MSPQTVRNALREYLEAAVQVSPEMNSRGVAYDDLHFTDRQILFIGNTPSERNIAVPIEMTITEATDDRPAFGRLALKAIANYLDEHEAQTRAIETGDVTDALDLAIHMILTGASPVVRKDGETIYEISEGMMDRLRKAANERT
jgi:hypothetical protein